MNLEELWSMLAVPFRQFWGGGAHREQRLDVLLHKGGDVLPVQDVPQPAVLPVVEPEYAVTASVGHVLYNSQNVREDATLQSMNAMSFPQLQWSYTVAITRLSLKFNIQTLWA